MNDRRVSLEDFYDWYQENGINLRESAKQYSLKNEELREEFLKEWPLDRILTLSIDEYVIGKGAQSNSFCYGLERGKYKSLFMGIGGGGSPFRLVNYNFHHEPKTYLKEVEKNKKAR